MAKKTLKKSKKLQSTKSLKERPHLVLGGALQIGAPD